MLGLYPLLQLSSAKPRVSTASVHSNFPLPPNDLNCPDFYLFPYFRGLLLTGIVFSFPVLPLDDTDIPLSSLQRIGSPFSYGELEVNVLFLFPCC